MSHEILRAVAWSKTDEDSVGSLKLHRAAAEAHRCIGNYSGSQVCASRMPSSGWRQVACISLMSVGAVGGI